MLLRPLASIIPLKAIVPVKPLGPFVTVIPITFVKSAGPIMLPLMAIKSVDSVVGVISVVPVMSLSLRIRMLRALILSLATMLVHDRIGWRGRR